MQHFMYYHKWRFQYLSIYNHLQPFDLRLSHLLLGECNVCRLQGTKQPIAFRVNAGARQQQNHSIARAVGIAKREGSAYWRSAVVQILMPEHKQNYENTTHNHSYEWCDSNPCRQNINPYQNRLAPKPMQKTRMQEICTQSVSFHNLICLFIHCVLHYNSCGIQSQIVVLLKIQRGNENECIASMRL